MGCFDAIQFQGSSGASTLPIAPGARREVFWQTAVSFSLPRFLVSAVCAAGESCHAGQIMDYRMRAPTLGARGLGGSSTNNARLWL